jgi:hypothetical protein
VDNEVYVLESSRYVVLNPVRAGMVQLPGMWPWSSYRAMMAETPAPKWLAVDSLLSHFGMNRKKARLCYRHFVLDGEGERLWEELRQQILLGNEQFAKTIQAKAHVEGDTLSIPQVRCRVLVPCLADIPVSHDQRNSAILAAHATGAYTYREIAELFCVHLSTVGRIVRLVMQQCDN